MITGGSYTDSILSLTKAGGGSVDINFPKSESIIKLATNSISLNLGVFGNEASSEGREIFGASTSTSSNEYLSSNFPICIESCLVGTKQTGHYFMDLYEASRNSRIFSIPEFNNLPDGSYTFEYFVSASDTSPTQYRWSRVTLQKEGSDFKGDRYGTEMFIGTRDRTSELNIYLVSVHQY